MYAFRSFRSRRSLASFASASLLAMTAAAAQVAGGGTPGDTGIDATGNYSHEVQACNSGQTQQDRDTCLREARNARADRQRTESPDARYQANATARCNVFTGDDRAACEARVMGYGSSSGSVAGGGILREVETVVMPAGQSEVTIEPKTSDPVVLVPATPAAQ